MKSSADVWSKVLGVLEEELTQTAVTTWFDDSRMLSLNENAITVFTPSQFKKDIITSRYMKAIQDALYAIFSVKMDVVIVSEEESSEHENNGGNQKEKSLTDDEFTFERFIVGNSNKFAHAAARAVSDSPASAYNPLFIYGDSGLGKTHLLYAIAHAVKKKYPDSKIVYIKGDDFTNELIEAIREGKNTEFRFKYRSADLFLIDDIQFIAGRVQTQEEFFHTFNSLYESKKQIVMTSDRPPKEMTRLEDRLKSRFEWGLLADIQIPDFETRMAIIKNKAIRIGLILPDEVADYIAQNVTSNIRQIEGIVKKLLAYNDFLMNNINMDAVSRAIKDILKENPGLNPTPKLIIEEVSKYFSIDEKELRGARRNRDTVLARQVAMFIIRKQTPYSLPDIGKEFQGRDHTTVMHAIEKIEEYLKKNPDFENTIRDITTNINSR